MGLIAPFSLALRYLINIVEMNILVLTPDRVGSTLLHRTISIYASFNESPDILTINTHELTNGITKYYSETLNTEIVSKLPTNRIWGYHQPLEHIVQLLDSVDHHKVSRLAHYHIKNRGDSLSDQVNFYRYLNDNFYIIACKRKNIFEHALSWSIIREAKTKSVFKGNAFTKEEKFEFMKEIHEHGLNVNQDAFQKHLDNYAEYIDWLDKYFIVNAYFEYERDVPDLERFITSLTPFNRTENRPITWEDRFGIEWNHWNRVHYLQSLEPFDHEYTEEETSFIAKHKEKYDLAQEYIDDLIKKGIMFSGIPIKLHTLGEKAKIIKNAPQLLEHYNNWASLAPPNVPALQYNPNMLAEAARQEQLAWSGNNPTNLLN